MYVEDDKDILELVDYILKPRCKKLLTADNGKDGLELYDRFKPDIVISDINMPLMDGLQMSKQLKTKEPDLPIVLVTSFDDTELLKEAINTGIDKYIQKPFSTESFLASLNAVVKMLELKNEKADLQNMIQTQSKIASMGEMIGNIAHQWRQPLNVISTAASSFLLNLELKGQVQKNEIIENSNQILDQVNYLSNTIDDFRDFYSKDDICVNFNIKNAVYKSISLVKDSYKSNSIEFILDLKDYEIEKKENELIQVFINILNNAKDAFIINNIEPDKRYVFIKMSVDEKKCTIFIKDSANGIDESVIERVFEPYFTTKFASQGTGIGLYMSHQIITEHFNGKITAYNKAYEFNKSSLKGACFKITLFS
jgi:signal transduction histidine kinase